MGRKLNSGGSFTRLYEVVFCCCDKSHARQNEDTTDEDSVFIGKLLKGCDAEQSGTFCVYSAKIDSHSNQKQEINFVWPYSKVF